jgi:DNA-3-methyladenine glycosylase I
MICPWAAGHPLLRAYHDQEWGVPLHDDRTLFELLTLEGAQAGLSWLQVLQRRDAYREAFRGFDPAKVARLDPERLLGAPGLIRNRLKLQSAVDNAKHVLELGSLDAFVWSFVPGGQPIRHRFTRPEEIPSRSPESDALSAALRARGFRFVGSTICYAFMQAAGLVDDHLSGCPASSRMQASSSSQKR